MLKKYSDVLTIKDICEILHISPKSAYSLVHKGKIPYIKIGRHYRVSKRSLEEFINTDVSE